MAMRLSLPEFGVGKLKKNGENFGMLKHTRMLIGQPTRLTVVAQVALFTSSMETLHMPQAEHSVLFL